MSTYIPLVIRQTQFDKASCVYSFKGNYENKTINNAFLNVPLTLVLIMSYFYVFVQSESMCYILQLILFHDFLFSIRGVRQTFDNL